MGSGLTRSVRRQVPLDGSTAGPSCSYRTLSLPNDRGNDVPGEGTAVRPSKKGSEISGTDP